jgi:hypothetical protein
MKRGEQTGGARGDDAARKFAENVRSLSEFCADLITSLYCTPLYSTTEKLWSRTTAMANFYGGKGDSHTDGTEGLFNHPPSAYAAATLSLPLSQERPVFGVLFVFSVWLSEGQVFCDAWKLLEQIARRTRSSMMHPWPDWRPPLASNDVDWAFRGCSASRGRPASYLSVAVQLCAGKGARCVTRGAKNILPMYTAHECGIDVVKDAPSTSPRINTTPSVASDHEFGRNRSLLSGSCQSPNL